MQRKSEYGVDGATLQTKETAGEGCTGYHCMGLICTFPAGWLDADGSPSMQEDKVWTVAIQPSLMRLVIELGGIKGNRYAGIAE